MSATPVITHRIIEIFGINEDYLKTSESLLPFIREFTTNLNLKVVKEEFHNFIPYGATLIFILSSSHMAVHTWPEKKYLHIDILTCSTLPNDNKIIEFLCKIFRVSTNQIKIRNIAYE